MALDKKVYGVIIPFSARILAVYGIFAVPLKSRKGVAAQSEIRHFRRFQLKLKLISDKGDKLRIGGFSFGIAYRVPKEPLQGV